MTGFLKRLRHGERFTASTSPDRIDRLNAALDFARSAIEATMAGEAPSVANLRAVLRIIERAQSGEPEEIRLRHARTTAILRLRALVRAAWAQRPADGNVATIVDEIIFAARRGK